MNTGNPFVEYDGLLALSTAGHVTPRPCSEASAVSRGSPPGPVAQDDVLARELRLHQGCLRHETPENGRMDGKYRKGLIMNKIEMYRGRK